FPFLRFIRATYSYTGDFQWQKSSDQYSDLTVEMSDGRTETYNLGNSVQNGSTHQINSSLDMKTLYRYIGLTKIRPGSRDRAQSERSANDTRKREILSGTKEPQQPASLVAGASM